MKSQLVLSALIISTLLGNNPEKAPDWVLQNTEGENIVLHDLKGKVLIINFWAIWCSTCKPELMELAQLQTEMKDKNVLVVGIGVDSGDTEFLSAFKKLLNLNFPLLTGKRRIVKRIMRDYGNIRRIPTLIIIDRDGNIAHKILEFKGKEELKILLQPLL